MNHTKQLLLDIFGPRQLGLGLAQAGDASQAIEDAEEMIELVMSLNRERSARCAEAEEMVTLTARRTPVYRHTTVTKGNLTLTLIERATL